MITHASILYFRPHEWYRNVNNWNAYFINFILSISNISLWKEFKKVCVLMELTAFSFILLNKNIYKVILGLTLYSSLTDWINWKLNIFSSVPSWQLHKYLWIIFILQKPQEQFYKLHNIVIFVAHLVAHTVYCMTFTENEGWFKSSTMLRGEGERFV